MRINVKLLIFIVFIVIFTLASQNIPLITTNAATTAAPTKLKVGDFVQFGHYNGDPILWRVININTDNSAILFSEKILCQKAFDASGDLTDGRGDNDRKKYGSNYWEKSNLREWLNSSDKRVKYSCQAPDNEHVWSGVNDYASEAGFLTNFTEKERMAILPVTHECLLSEADISVKDGGTETIITHAWNNDINDVIQNSSSAYYKNITDKVYLLNVKELYDYIYSRGWNYNRKPTAKTVQNSEKKVKWLTTGNYWFYWIITPSGSDTHGLRGVNGVDGVGIDAGAYDGTAGIVPAINLLADILISSGKGSNTNPYKVDISAK